MVLIDSLKNAINEKILDRGNFMAKNSTSDFRFLIGFPFGLLAETFARIAIWVSGNQLDVDFNYLGKRQDRQG